MYPVPQSAAAPAVQPAYGTPDRQLWDAVNYASEDDFVKLMDIALKAGAHLDSEDADGKNLLQIAVERNSTRIVRALVAWGAPLPAVPPNGVDLLMKAAAQGNTAMVTLLTDVADMTPSYEDSTGQTALHHAVRFGNVQAAEALLDRDAEIDACAYGLSAAELDEIFGEHHHLFEKGITPLSVATAMQHIPTVQLLLDRGARISSGRANPLRIAVRKQDPAMLDMLIKHCARVGKLSDVVNQNLLTSALFATMQTHLLRQILDCRQWQSNDQTRIQLDLDNALLTAVTLGHIDQVAVLISAGAHPGSPTDADNRIWAAASEVRDPAMMNLLITAQGASFAALLEPRDGQSPALLTELCDLIDEPINLAIHGIFVGAIFPVISSLQTIADRKEAMSSAQIAAETAHALSGLIAADDSGTASEVATANESISSSQWQPDRPPIPHAQSGPINDAITTQKSRIIKLATTFIESLQASLVTVLSGQFLLESRDETGNASSHIDVAAMLLKKMTKGLGMPEPLARLLSRAWIDAERVIAGESASSAAPDADAVARLMTNTLFCTLTALKTRPGSLLGRCKQSLLVTLSASREPLQRLVRQPAEFLRALEQRTGLRPVNLPALTQSLTASTGLPYVVCSALASCWQRAVSDAGNDRTLAVAGKRFLAVDTEFARHWQAWLEAHRDDAGKADFPFTAEEVLQSIDWCVQARQQSRGTLKRKAEAEAEGAPPHKAARTPPGQE